MHRAAGDPGLSPTRAEWCLTLLGAAALAAFVLLALGRASGAGAAFAVALLGLHVAAACGPATFSAPAGAERVRPALVGLRRCVLIGLLCAAAGV